MISFLIGLACGFITYVVIGIIMMLITKHKKQKAVEEPNETNNINE